MRKVLRAQVFIKGTICSILMITLTRQRVYVDQLPKESNIRTNDNVAYTAEEVTEVDVHHCRWRHGGGLEPAWVKRKEWVVSVLSLLPKERRVGGGGGGKVESIAGLSPTAPCPLLCSR